MNAVDLDDNAKAFPSDVKNVRPVAAEPNDLAARFWEETHAAPTREVQLAEGLRPAHQIKQDSFNEAPTTIAPYCE